MAPGRHQQTGVVPPPRWWMAAIVVVLAAVLIGVSGYWLRQTRSGDSGDALPAEPPSASAKPAVVSAPNLTPSTPAEPPTPVRTPAAIQAMVNDVVRDIPCTGATVTAGAAGLVITGFAGDAEQGAALRQGIEKLSLSQPVIINIVLRPPPFCTVLSLVALLAAGPPPAAPPPVVLTLSHADGVYREGDALMLDVTAPAPAGGFLTVDYYDLSGTVVHMVPMPLQTRDRLDAGQTVRLGADPATATADQRYYQAAPPFGLAMIVAILSDKPLFVADRTEAEPAAGYLPQFGAALRGAAAGGGQPPRTAVIFLETRGRE